MARILLVDDDPDLLASLQQYLEQAGFEVVAVPSASEALTFLPELPPDAAVLDVVMPGSSGYDLLRQLRATPTTARIPVIFLSGLSSSIERVRGLSAGADDYLVKPFEPAELVLRLNKLLARKELASGSGALGGDLEEAVARVSAVLAGGGSIRGLTLGRYQLDSILGEGGHGVVFRAFDRILLRPVAVKMLHFEEGESPDQLRAALLREAVLAARLSHPHIVAIYDFQETSHAAFIIMELVEGVGLDRYILAKGKLTPEEALAVGAAVAQALACAHNQRLIHRDLKPGNILLGRDGAIKVSDFGIATFLSSQAKGPGEIFGTPGFLAPECIRGQPYDEKGDLFALGVTLYLCLTGKAPFSAGNILQTLERTLTFEPQPPHLLDPSIPLELSQLVMNLLAKERGRRPPSAASLAALLERWVQERKIRWQPDVGALERAASRPSTLFPSSIFPSQSLP
jgi:serine/threonine-protein kinase